MSTTTMAGIASNEAAFRPRHDHPVAEMVRDTFVSVPTTATVADALGAGIALAIFIPLVMDMGGNVGTQSSTIFARGYALGHVTIKDFWRRNFAREALVGATMAVGIALIAGVVAHFWQGVPNDIPNLGIVVGAALFTSVFLASMLGFLMPYILVRIGVDHAPGADPFITTIKDFSGLLVYFSMAAWLIGIEM